MLTSKQRNYLRKLAVSENPVIYIGKGGIDREITNQSYKAIVARELIKGKVQQNAPIDARSAAEELSLHLKADVVTVLGNTFVLFKRNPQHIRIDLPTKKNELK